jgi:alkanesulfonate monooxygenase SsuD/methylene tetrahydromethanopterin reductase-like flavin-dependent oxidoreductase (luciferase family)
VANLPLRPPAMLARAVASLDILAGGRVELGIGTGAFWDAITAMGGPRRTAGESVDALREAVAVIRALWTPARGARFDAALVALVTDPVRGMPAVQSTIDLLTDERVRSSSRAAGRCQPRAR